MLSNKTIKIINYFSVSISVLLSLLCIFKYHHYIHIQYKIIISILNSCLLFFAISELKKDNLFWYYKSLFLQISIFFLIVWSAQKNK